MKISSKKAAVRAVIDVNQSAKKILADMAKLSLDLNELNTFMRLDSEEYKSFSNAYKIRTAGTELIRIDRKLSASVPALKSLSNMKYPEPLFLEEEDEEEEPEEIDKNPHSTSIIDSLPKEEVEEDGEEKI